MILFTNIKQDNIVENLQLLGKKILNEILRCMEKGRRTLPTNTRKYQPWPKPTSIACKLEVTLVRPRICVAQRRQKRRALTSDCCQTLSCRWLSLAVRTICKSAATCAPRKRIITAPRYFNDMLIAQSVSRCN